MALLLGGLSSTAAWSGELGIRLTVLPQTPLASVPTWPGLQPLRVGPDGQGFYSVAGTAPEALQWLRAQALEKDLTVVVIAQHDAGWEGWLSTTESCVRFQARDVPGYGLTRIHAFSCSVSPAG